MSPWCPTAVPALLAVLLALAGCSSLLPTAQNELRGGWRDFDDAKRTIEAITPYRTTREELHASGIDPYANPAITILTGGD